MKVGDTFWGHSMGLDFFATITKIGDGVVRFDYTYTNETGTYNSNYICMPNRIHDCIQNYLVKHSPLGQALS